MKIDPLKPSITLLCKLGSIAVHAEEMLGPNGHHFDRVALDATLQDEGSEGMDQSDGCLHAAEAINPHSFAAR